MLKVKHERECDCVVAGFRWHKKGDATRSARCCSVCSTTPARCSTSACARASRKRSGSSWWSFSRRTARTRSAITRGRRGRSRRRRTAGQRMPGGQSRWSQGKDLSWEPLRPELVVEVAYDHMQGDRFRHTAQFRRWRTDKKPRDCTYAQLEVVPPQELAAIFATASAEQRFLRCPLAPFARRIVVRVGRLLRGPHALRAHCAGSRECASRSTSGRASNRPARRRRREFAASGCFALPALEARERRFLSGEFATTISGIFVRGFGVASSQRPSRATARRAAPRPPSCGSAAATARRRDPRLRPAPRARAVLRASPALSSMPACGSPISAKRFGTVSTVKSAGSQSGTSFQ